MSDSDKLEVSPDGYTVRRNGVTMRKPSYMSDSYWFKYEAPRCGTKVGKGGKFLYGMKPDMPKWGEDERGVDRDWETLI